MSLDCYPLGPRHCISHSEQPVAIDVAYNDNLFITITNHSKTIQVYDLLAKESGAKLYNSIKLSEDALVEQLVYCRQGDYLAFIGDKNGELSLYTVFNWRNRSHEDPETQAIVRRLEIKTDIDSTIDSNETLYCIDACQRTGNLAIGCGCSVLIYRYHNVKDERLFEHIVTINLSMSARRISLLENYLAVTAVDHVQVLKLELLTLQLQTDSFDVEHQQTFNSGVSSIAPTIGKTNETTPPNQVDTSRGKSLSIPHNAIKTDHGDKEAGNNNANNAQATQNVGITPTNRTATKTGTNSSTSTGLTTCSFLSRSESETTTNFSSLIGDEGFNGLEFNKSDMSIVMIHNQQQQAQSTCNNNNSAIPDVVMMDGHSNDDCITWNLNTKKLVKLPTLMHNTSTNLSSYHVCHPLELLGPASESIACRVKASIFSTEFCQNQLEAVVLLCKQCEFDKDPVKSLHLVATYLANKDAQRRICHQRLNPTQSSSTQGCATSNVGEVDTHEIVTAGMTSNSFGHPQTTTGLINNHVVINNDYAADTKSDCEQLSLLKSNDYDLLASVTCFVATLTSCFVYALTGKKVTKLQTITYPDVCLDLRPDILNVHILTPLGLQICSNGICDAMLRYDWSSSADLNLNFIATNRIRVLTTERYVLLVASQATSDDANKRGQQSYLIEYMEKPKLDELHNCFLHTLSRCSSVSVRSNMLTYLHASTQLAISCVLNQESLSNNEIITMLKSVTIMLCKQLFLKKQSNVITNNRIDKAIKHLLDISFCNLSELMSRHLSNLITSTDNSCTTANQLSKAHTCYQSQVSLCHDGANQPAGTGNNEVSDENDASSDKISYELTDQKRSSTAAAVGGSGEDSNRVCNGQSNMFMNSCDASVDTDYELIKIYLKHAKHSQYLLDYLLSQSTNEQVCARTIGYIFEHNPRMLIKCAQRYPIDASILDKSSDTDTNSESGASVIVHRRIMWILAERLKQLAEFDSTGINRATVLFTLAILYEALGERQQCLRSLEQIKPFQHLAITMRSNHELSHSIAPVVREKYPEAYELFLIQLAKRDPMSASKFASTYGPEHTPVSQSGYNKRNNNKTRAKKTPKCNGIAAIDALNDEEAMDGFGHQGGNESSDNDDEEVENEYLYERKLKLFSELHPNDIIDVLTSVGFDEKEAPEKHEATRAHIKASINLLESQYLLTRLNENYAHPT